MLNFHSALFCERASSLQPIDAFITLTFIKTSAPTHADRRRVYNLSDINDSRCARHDASISLLLERSKKNASQQEDLANREIFSSASSDEEAKQFLDSTKECSKVAGDSECDSVYPARFINLL